MNSLIYVLKDEWQREWLIATETHNETRTDDAYISREGPAQRNSERKSKMISLFKITWQANI